MSGQLPSDASLARSCYDLLQATDETDKANRH